MDSNDEKSSNAGVPPKIDPTKTPPSPEPAFPGKRQTTRVDLAAAEAGEAKKKTSRLPLEAALGTDSQRPAQTGTPKTIRIKRPLMAPTVAPSTPEEPPAQPEGDVKRKTSRIELEAALTASAAAEPEKPAPAGATPKTIRIKRPSQVSGARMAPPGAPVEAETRPDAGPSLKSQTSRIEAAIAAPEPAATPTQRKTIRIRRPEGGPRVTVASRAVTIARPEEAAAVKTEAKAEEKGVGAVFVIAAIAAALVVCVLIYVLAAQALPNLNLGFPGKIVS